MHNAKRDEIQNHSFHSIENLNGLNRLSAAGLSTETAAQQHARFGANTILEERRVGCFKASIGLGIFVLLLRFGFSPGETQSSVFLYEALPQLVFAYPVRHRHVMPDRNRWLHVAVIGNAALQRATLLFPLLQTSLGLNILKLQLFIIIAACVFGSWVIAEITSQFANWGHAPPN